MENLQKQFSDEELLAFSTKVLDKGRELYRDLPWRNTRDPYEIWISEVMLQQTQVSRVDGRWQSWLSRFPNVRALAEADKAEVLEEWQGMGYNRRALALKTAAESLAERKYCLPESYEELLALPGVGPATAAGIRAFAYEAHGVYLETNVRTVFLHELFPHEQKVADKLLIPLVERTCPPDKGEADTVSPRTWYYALLDYGADLKKRLPNPSRRSATHTKQSTFEGSWRQKRAELLRLLLEHKAEGLNFDVAVKRLAEFEEARGREAVAPEQVKRLLDDLVSEEFCSFVNGIWYL